jgi:hypothetical protein
MLIECLSLGVPEDWVLGKQSNPRYCHGSCESPPKDGIPRKPSTEQLVVFSRENGDEIELVD